MELPVEINSSIVDWLSSMGYPVAGMPEDLIRRMLLHEAQQWQLSPSKLAALINEGVRQSIPEGIDVRQVAREPQYPRRLNWFVGAHG